jgi:hypothetical protein
MVQPGTWTVGGLVQNTWSVAGDDARADVSLLFAQVFVTKGLSGGWRYRNSRVEAGARLDRFVGSGADRESADRVVLSSPSGRLPNSTLRGKLRAASAQALPMLPLPANGSSAAAT